MDIIGQVKSYASPIEITLCLDIFTIIPAFPKNFLGTKSKNYGYFLK